MGAEIKVGVVGAGNMGGGIAQKLAMEGFPVVLCDLGQAQLDLGMERIAKILDEGVARRAVSPAAKEAALSRLEATPDFGRLASCQLVIEAVFEDLKVKRDLFARLEKIVPISTVLATNTSSFLVRDIAEGLEYPRRVVGLHFFFHPVKNRLVEVIPSEMSDPDLVKFAWNLMAASGKTPIATADAPGFCVNRYFVPWLNEAVRLLDERVASAAAIEAAAQEHFKIGMGPFELMNVTGVPIAYHAAASLGKSLGGFYAPAQGLRRQFESGKPWDLSGPAEGAPSAEIAGRLFAAVWAVAGQILDEGVATIEDVDRGAKIGLRWSLGPFEWMNRKGVAAAFKSVEALAATNPGLNVAQCLKDQAASGKAWHFRLVDSKIEGGVATLTINRPEALNALNGEVLGQLEEAFDQAVADPAAKGIVLRGAGKAFVAGADVRFFVKNMEAGKIPDIKTFTARGQAFFAKIAACPKPVTAVLHGLALGGGAELALTAHRVIATPKGSIGFPETGIGIYPALGGTFRTTRRTGIELARYLLLTGRIAGAQEAFDMGLVDAVVDPLALEKILAEVAVQPAAAPPGPRKDFAAINAAFGGASPALMDGGYEASPETAPFLKAVQSKAPIAVRYALDLMDKNKSASDPEAYANELSLIEAIFATRDALVGLKSAGREKAVFQGK